MPYRFAIMHDLSFRDGRASARRTGVQFGGERS
ncbi:hypothetical protein HPGCJGGD_3234 [Methylobacterium haplocladii]|nr:hypothetical protein HPGCJGGD_3234 [Methylobacterium haplocladii]